MRQLKAGAKKIIDAAKVTLLVYRIPLVDNGLDELVPDPYGTADAHTVTGRVVMERSTVPNLSEGAIGLEEAVSYFLLTLPEEDIQVDDTFEHNGRKWRVVTVDKIVMSGVHTHNRSKLEEVANG